MKVKFLTLLLLLTAFVFTKCSKDALNDPSTSPEIQDVSAAKDKLLTLLKEYKITSKVELEIQRIAAEEKIKGHNSLSTRNSDDAFAQLAHNEDYMYYRNLVKRAVERAINPDDYECSHTILDDYFANATANWTPRDGAVFNFLGFIAFDEAYYLDNTEGEDFIGDKGQYTAQIRKVHNDLKRFWDIPTDIILGDAHGSVYKDIPTVAKILQLYYPIFENGEPKPMPASLALELAQLAKTVFSSAAFENYNHPLLTFNAFAGGDPGLGIPKKIVMGDGLMRAYNELGYGDVVGQLVMAHEYGHHIQFATGVLEITEPYNDPEKSRRTELMADAYGAYFCSHKKGVAMNTGKQAKVQEVSFSIGDCAFDNVGHHGTPNQRSKAAQFGQLIATDPYRRNEIISGSQFSRIFDALLIHMIKPDGLHNNSNLNF